MVLSNYRYYLDYIKGKYVYSKKYYDLEIDDKSALSEYLMRYEGMNVYPAYPLPIIMPISNNEYKGVGNMDIKSTLTNKFKNVLLENKLNEKIK